MLLTVSLPVRTSLHQNTSQIGKPTSMCHYQSERHCTKTGLMLQQWRHMCHYQSERHCTKTTMNKVELASSVITSQNVTAPKHVARAVALKYVSLPVRTSLHQNTDTMQITDQRVSLPVRTSLHQNSVQQPLSLGTVSLPVRTSLHQNVPLARSVIFLCHYQSERHCTKTAD